VKYTTQKSALKFFLRMSRTADPQYQLSPVAEMQLHLRLAAMGPGCVKTPKLNSPLEVSSRLHQFKKQKRWRPRSGEDNRETNQEATSAPLFAVTRFA
jgi:hypothetical protein